MKNIILIMISAILFVACQNSLRSINGVTDSNPTENKASGTRNFKMDSNQPFVMVSVYGVSMGTVDYTSMTQFLKFSQTSGVISSYNLIQTGIEGGGTFCIALKPDLASRTSFLNDLERFPTDLKETNFSAESVSQCSSSN
ncbi:MAG: hypothetical protein H7061_07715 [Bdellovibrionaceae bacterium]|nr:hypothetical protein [Bdellovibrio sp.]